MLDEFEATTGYHRKPRSAYYTLLNRWVLLRLAELFDQISHKRLRAATDVTLPALRANGFLAASAEVYRDLEQISPAIMDKLRAGDLQRPGHGRCLTKPGTLLKQQISIRTYADWNDKRPGCLEMDLVAHSGGLASFIQID